MRFESLLHGHADRRHGRIGDQRHVLSGRHDDRLVQRQNIVAFRHFALLRIEAFVFDEHDGIGIADGRLQQSFHLIRRRRRNDLQAGDADEQVRQRLRMARAVAAFRATRRPQHHRNVDLSVVHVMQLARAVHHLIQRQRHEIHEHDLQDRLQPHHRGADGDARDAAFGNRRLPQAFRPVFLPQALRDAESAAVAADVFADHDDVRIAGQLFVQCFVNGFGIIYFAHG